MAAIYATVMAAGYVSGPLLVSVTGIEGWVPFLAVAAASLFGLVPVLLVRSARPALDRKMQINLFGVMRAVPLVMAAAFVTGFVDTSLFTLIPIHEVRAGHAEQLALLSLSVFTAGNLVLQYPLGWIADRTNRRSATI